MMGHWGYGIGIGGSFEMFFGWLFMLVFWGLIFWGIVAFIQWSTRQRGEKKESNALAILEERYAKGEISKAEFEEKKKDLKT